MYRKRFGNTTFKKKFVKRFKSKRSFNKRKYSSRRFTKPTKKQTIKYNKLEDMIRNKVVYRKFEALGQVTGLTNGGDIAGFVNVETCFENSDLKAFVSEYSEFSISSLDIYYVHRDCRIEVSHRKPAGGLIDVNINYTGADPRALFTKTSFSGPSPVTLKQKFNFTATHKYNRTSPWFNVTDFLSIGINSANKLNYLPEVPWIFAKAHSVDSYVFHRIIVNVACRNFKTAKSGFTGLAMNRADGIVNTRLAVNPLLSADDAKYLLDKQLIKSAPTVVRVDTTDRMMIETPAKLN